MELADLVTLITPGRFLYRAGSTPKSWNDKMLSDPHFKVIKYYGKSVDVFPNTDIKGGVVITLWDKNKDFGAIETFVEFPELQSIMHKAAPKDEADKISNYIYIQNKFDLDALYSDHPEYKNVIGSKGADKRFRNNIFDKIGAFTESREHDDDIKVIGLIDNKRVWRYLPRKYFDMDHENIDKFKVLVPRSNGSGSLGETLSTPLIGSPLIGSPLIGYTQTFIGIGSFDTQYEADAALKYVKSKFCRVMLGVLKVTQDNNRATWAMVPMQDFTSNSDIDWTKSIPEIDQQLYKKYGLSDEDINFIETKVQEMD